jgi:Flp pilus assembly protein TadD
MSRIFAITFIVIYLCIAGSRTDVYAQSQSVDTPDHRLRGINLYEQGDMKGAAEALRVAVKQRKDDAEAWYYLGLALNRAGDAKGARKAFEASVKLRPENDEAHTGLAYTLLLANKSRQAEREAERALELNSQNTEAHYIIGVIRLRDGVPEKALEKAETALKMKPDFSGALLLKVQALFNVFAQVSLASNKEQAVRFSRLKEAGESLERFLKLSRDPSEAEVWREQLNSLRAYGELADKSDPDRTIFDLDEITVPRRILDKPEPAYSEEARRAGVGGKVVLLAILAADRKVKHILLLQSLSYGLTREAIIAARKIKFEPSMKDGRPVSQVALLEYNFHPY